VYSNAYFGAGTGPIYLDDVTCTSSASQLLECSSRPILTHNCLHSADAGVGCEGIVFRQLSTACTPRNTGIINCNNFISQCSSLFKWTIATGRGQHSK